MSLFFFGLHHESELRGNQQHYTDHNIRTHQNITRFRQILISNNLLLIVGHTVVFIDADDMLHSLRFCTFSTISSEFSTSSSSSSCFLAIFLFLFVACCSWILDVSQLIVIVWMLSSGFSKTDKHSKTWNVNAVLSRLHQCLRYTEYFTYHTRTPSPLSTIHIYRLIRTATTTISITIAYYYCVKCHRRVAFGFCSHQLVVVAEIRVPYRRKQIHRIITTKMSRFADIILHVNNILLLPNDLMPKISPKSIYLCARLFLSQI